MNEWFNFLYLTVVSRVTLFVIMQHLCLISINRPSSCIFQEQLVKMVDFIKLRLSEYAPNILYCPKQSYLVLATLNLAT